MQRQSVCQNSAWKKPKHTLQVTLGGSTLQVTLKFLLNVQDGGVSRDERCFTRLDHVDEARLGGHVPGCWGLHVGEGLELRHHGVARDLGDRDAKDELLAFKHHPHLATAEIVAHICLCSQGLELEELRLARLNDGVLSGEEQLELGGV